MSDRQPHPEDLPWNDAPADSEYPPGTEEPEPAEVVGDEGDERDASTPRVPDPEEKYRTESLDQRLAEEEPERAPRSPEAPLAGELVDPDQGGADAEQAEADGEEDIDEPGAEEAAVHVRDEGDV